MGIASLILGIIALIFILILPIVSVICGIVGIILGIIEIIRKTKSKQKASIPIVGTILSGIALFIILCVVFCFAISSVINTSTLNQETIYGEWYDSEDGLTLILNEDGTFKWYSDDKSTLYIEGEYTVETDFSEHPLDEYILTMSATSRVVNGKTLTTSYTTQFSLQTEDYKSGVVVNVLTYSSYTFEKQD